MQIFWMNRFFKYFLLVLCIENLYISSLWSCVMRNRHMKSIFEISPKLHRSRKVNLRAQKSVSSYERDYNISMLSSFWRIIHDVPFRK